MTPQKRSMRARRLAPEEIRSCHTWHAASHLSHIHGHTSHSTSHTTHWHPAHRHSTHHTAVHTSPSASHTTRSASHTAHHAATIKSATKLSTHWITCEAAHRCFEAASHITHALAGKVPVEVVIVHVVIHATPVSIVAPTSSKVSTKVTSSTVVVVVARPSPRIFLRSSCGCIFW